MRFRRLRERTSDGIKKEGREAPRRRLGQPNKRTREGGDPPVRPAEGDEAPSLHEVREAVHQRVGGAGAVDVHAVVTIGESKKFRHEDLDALVNPRHVPNQDGALAAAREHGAAAPAAAGEEEEPADPDVEDHVHEAQGEADGAAGRAFG